jgi:FlaA1/EpsC-like NDP-sugar epimerase
MTIPEACQLIMQAETIGQGGEVFVLDMGEPVKITYLAEQMIRLSGKVPNKDIEIRIVGLRPGEKLYEELFHDQEQLLATGHEKLRLAKARLYDSVEWARQIENLQSVCQHYDNEQLLAGLKQLVPEFNNTCG